MSCVCHGFASVYCYLVVTCLERADLLAFVCDVSYNFDTFPFGILGQAWYLIVWIPVPCRFSYFGCFSLNASLVLLLLTFCLLLLPLWESVIVLCFVVRYFMSILVLQSSGWGRESWLLCLICLPGVS